MKGILHYGVIFVLLMCLAGTAAAQSDSPAPSPTPTPKRHTTVIKDILDDQKTIWTVPFRLDRDDVKWAVPLAIGGAALIATDRTTSSHVPMHGENIPVSRKISWGGTVFIDGGIAAGFYFYGREKGDPKARETGLLIAETMIDSGIVVGVLKNVSQRVRPNMDHGSGEFFDGGSSFPSGHSSSVWSVATIVALEYHDKPAVKYGAIAAASAVSISRFTGRNHFLSDVAVGSAIGIYTAKFVYKRRHNYAFDAPDQSSPPETTSLFRPLLAPEYDGRSKTYGLKAVWWL